MKISAELPIDAEPMAIWRVITQLENAAKTIRAIEHVEVLHRPAEGVVGLRWRETRTMFGSKATEELWIDEAKEGEYYVAKANSCGCEYTSRISISPRENGSLLSMTLDAKPTTLFSKLTAGLMGWMMAGTIKKAILQDLGDIKAAVEQGGAG